MSSRKIEYTDGKTGFVGELFLDDSQSGKRPGVVVFPEAFGLNDHARDRARRLTELGYAALAADLHGDGQVYEDFENLRPRMEGLYADREGWRAMAQAALGALANQPEVDADNVAAIGFCFGGTTALELARSGAALKAITTFHAGLLPEQPEDKNRMAAKVMICHGSEDPMVEKSAIDTVMDEFRRDNVDWQFTFYGNAAHSFTDPDADSRGMPGLSYDATTEARSWAAMRLFFEEVLG